LNLVQDLKKSRANIKKIYVWGKMGQVVLVTLSQTLNVGYLLSQPHINTLTFYTGLNSVNMFYILL